MTNVFNTNFRGYTPHSDTKAYLDYALSKVKSVPYKPTLRWLFYQMVQGHGFDKNQYDAFKQVIIKVRKQFYGEWYPGILADDTRTSHLRGWGSKTPKGWLSLMKSQKCDLRKFKSQGVYVECWFEANAMYQQFEYWTAPYHVTLVPFGGDPSIPFKWNIAKRLQHVKNVLKLPIVILYFGDYDKQGQSIPESAYRDISKWAGFDFKFIRVGLNPSQAAEYNLPENPSKPNTYQWEALNHYDAGKLIVLGLNPHIRLFRYHGILKLEKTTTKAYRKLFDNGKVSA